MMSKNEIQGEGDVKSAKRYNEKAQNFVESEGAEALTSKDDHSGDLSKGEMAQAEEAALEKAKETDPEAAQ